MNFTDEEGKKAKVTVNQEAIDKDLKFAGYNLLVTSETDMLSNMICIILKDTKYYRSMLRIQAFAICNYMKNMK